MRKLFLSLLILLGVSAPAHALEPYVVSGVTVDVTADSAAKARNQAIKEASRKAFMNLATQLSPGQPIPDVTDKAIGDIVSDFRIESEKSGGKRYVGSFTFRFRPNQVRGAFGARDIPSPRELASRGPQQVAPEQQTGTAEFAPHEKTASDVIKSVAAENAAPPAPAAEVPGVEPQTIAYAAPPKFDAGPEQMMLIQVPAESIQKMAVAPEMIRATTGVTKIEFRTVTPTRAVMAMSYQGDTTQLLQNLQQRGVKLQSAAQSTPPVYTLMP